MRKYNVNKLELEGAQLCSLNFSGTKREGRRKNGGTFIANKEGDRNFTVKIYDEELANNLKREGWNVKTGIGAEGDLPVWYLKVKVKFGMYPPKIYLITDKDMTLMNEQSISTLDRAQFQNVDLIINPSPYENDNGEFAGIAAYLDKAYITLRKDRFAEKYAYLLNKETEAVEDDGYSIESDEIPY